MFDRISQNPDFIFVTGDFNVWFSSWWKTDLTTIEGNHVDAIPSPYGWSQLICRPEHILLNLSSCIDQIFTNNNNSS